MEGEQAAESRVVMPRWYRARVFWLGLLGLMLLVGAWVSSQVGGRGHTRSWVGKVRYTYVTYGGGWMGVGTMDLSVPSPTTRLLKAAGSRTSTWSVAKQKATAFPLVQFSLKDGGAGVSIHYGFWVVAWCVGWLALLGARYLPRRVRPPRFPGSRRRWYASPWLWGGVPGMVVLVALWMDSAGHRTYGSYRWVREKKPDYLGFGMESNQGLVTAWAGRPYEGIFSRRRVVGFGGFRQKSMGTHTHVDASAGKWRERWQVRYGVLGGIYLAVWCGLAGGWQWRERRRGGFFERRLPGRELGVG